MALYLPSHILISTVASFLFTIAMAFRYAGFGCFSSGNITAASRFAVPECAAPSLGAHLHASDGVSLSGFMSASICSANSLSAPSRISAPDASSSISAV